MEEIRKGALQKAFCPIVFVCGCGEDDSICLGSSHMKKYEVQADGRREITKRNDGFRRIVLALRQ